MFSWKWSVGEPCEKSLRNNDKNSNTYLNHEINFVKESKREYMDEKLSNRAMIAQIGLNPFLNNSSYQNDIQVYDKIMKK
jgi:hypothetical protein